MIAVLLGWSKLPQWAMELIVIAIVAGGVWYWQHERFESGIQEQQLADASARQKLAEDTAKQTALLQIQANVASTAYENEHKANVDYQFSHPVVGVCLTPSGRSGVPKASSSKPGNVDSRPATANLPTVPGGDIKSNATVNDLLKNLAMRCDDVSAVLREYQTR